MGWRPGDEERMSRQRRCRRRLLCVRRLSAHFHDRAFQVESRNGQLSSDAAPGEVRRSCQDAGVGVLE